MEVIMEKKSDFWLSKFRSGCKVLVFGGGITGKSVIEFLTEKGAKPILIDSQMPDLRIPVFSDKSSLSEIGSFDLVIKSPGINPRKSLLFQEILNSKIPVFSEIGLARIFFKGKVIGITGTDGKSTTTALTNHIISSSFKSKMGGNIGVPFISFCEENLDFAVLELSSYQLEDSDNLEIFSASILNIASDHLERHINMENYLFAKSKIAQNAKFLILNDRQKEKFQFDNFSGKIKFFGFTKHSDGYIDLENECIYAGESKYDTSKFPLIGNHNLENLAAAILLSESAGCNSESIQNSLESFIGLSHRFQKFHNWENSIFINDSKSTNLHSLLSGLKAFSKNDNLLLILGGIPKLEPIDSMIERLLELDCKVYLYGAAIKEWEGILNKSISHNLCVKQNLEDIVLDIKRTITDKNKNTILLSPACASQDQYKNFEERGNHFMDLVNKYFT
jgi:UDP-N-acetylmuramoylalanine--D-glutamate ligase